MMHEIFYVHSASNEIYIFAEMTTQTKDRRLEVVKVVERMLGDSIRHTHVNMWQDKGIIETI